MRTKFYPENLRGIDRLGDLGVDGRIILKCILKDSSSSVRTVFSWLRIRWICGLF
jgi:hypothetical protein